MTRRATLLVAVLLAAGPPACAEEEDWSPFDGPWDPDHPEAEAVLAAPEPDEPVDGEMAEAGERWYRQRGCLACHALTGEEVVGPSLDGVTDRRSYEWYRGMVMRPDSMLRSDPVARQLLRAYRVPMPDQGVDELRARAMWEFLRARDRGRCGSSCARGTAGREADQGARLQARRRGRPASEPRPGARHSGTRDAPPPPTGRTDGRQESEAAPPTVAVSAGPSPFVPSAEDGYRRRT